MTQCPRCGFEQPRDRFCAKCGIMMTALESKKPEESRASINPLFFIVPLAVIILLGVLYFLNHHSLTSLESPSQVTSLPATPKKFVPPAVFRPSNKPLAPEKSSNETIPAVATVTPEPAVAASPTPATATEATTVSVGFDMVNKEVMERLSQEGEGRLEIGRYSVTVVPQFKSKYDGVKSDTNFHHLSEESKALAVSEPSLVFGGGKEPKTNDAIGFFVEITPTRMTERGMEYRTSIKRSLPELSSTNEVKVTSQNFDDTLVIPIGSGVVIAGLLPRKSMAEGEDELYKNNILRALVDPDFQKGENEFLIVLNLY
jgi:hypothetical protein